MGNLPKPVPRGTIARNPSMRTEQQVSQDLDLCTRADVFRPSGIPFNSNMQCGDLLNDSTLLQCVVDSSTNHSRQPTNQTRICVQGSNGVSNSSFIRQPKNGEFTTIATE